MSRILESGERVIMPRRGLLGELLFLPKAGIRTLFNCQDAKREKRGMTHDTRLKMLRQAGYPAMARQAGAAAAHKFHTSQNSQASHDPAAQIKADGGT